MTSRETDLAIRSLELEWMEAHRLRQMAICDLHRHELAEHPELVAQALARVLEMESLKKEILFRTRAIEEALLD